MTCFNRKAKTLACLEAVERSTAIDWLTLDAILIDDASTDGTVHEVRKRHPWVKVIESSGDLYWCRGMHLAYKHALDLSYDHYIWLNDDTMLYPDAVARFLATERQVSSNGTLPAIVVGSTVNPTSGKVTYGGERIRSKLRCLSLSRVQPTSQPLALDTMNGNFVLINSKAARYLGNLDPFFEHAMGDTDFGLRARKCGIGLWLVPGIVAECSHNNIEGTYLDRKLPLRRRWQLLLGRKGLPWRSWLHLTKRHGGVIWFIYFVWPYIRFLTTALRHSNNKEKI